MHQPSPTELVESQLRSAIAKGLGGQLLRELPASYVPGEFDVICGRGKEAFQHIGNDRFRRLVESRLEEYSNAITKLEKSYILSDIVCQVRQNSPTGGFVKRSNEGQWFEVGDFIAREKTSQAFRDALHDQYKSSNTAKKKRRQAQQAEKVGPDGSQSSLNYSSGSLNYSFTATQSGQSMPAQVTPSHTGLFGVADSETDGPLGFHDSHRSVIDLNTRLSTRPASTFMNKSCPNLVFDDLDRSLPDLKTEGALSYFGGAREHSRSVDWHHSQPIVHVEEAVQYHPGNAYQNRARNDALTPFGEVREPRYLQSQPLQQQQQQQAPGNRAQSWALELEPDEMEVDEDDLILSPIGNESPGKLMSSISKLAEDAMRDHFPRCDNLESLL